MRNKTQSKSTRDMMERTLTYAAFGYAIGMVVHGADHAFRGLTGDSHHVAWPGGLQIVMAALTVAISAIVVTLVLSEHKYAPVASMIIGFGSAIVFLVIHLLPEWGGINDSYVTARGGARVTTYSWGTAAIGITAATLYGWAGLRVYRRTRRVAHSSSTSRML